MPTINRGTRDYPYYVWVEPRVLDLDLHRRQKRQAAERLRFKALTPDERAREMAATGLQYRYTGPPLFVHRQPHSESSHHVGKCDSECRAGSKEHAHRVRKHLLRQAEARRNPSKKRRGRARKSTRR